MDKNYCYYSLQEYFKNDMEIEKFNADDMNISFYDIVSNEKTSPWWNFGLGLTLTEYLSIVIFSKKYSFENGWRIYRTPLCQSKKSTFYINIGLYKDFEIKPESINETGCPDFLFCNMRSKDYFFIEVKHGERNLRKSQSD